MVALSVVALVRIITAVSPAERFETKILPSLTKLSPSEPEKVPPPTLLWVITIGILLLMLPSFVEDSVKITEL